MWTLVVFSLFSAIVLASKHRWDASMIMVCTQLPALYLYYRWVYPPAGRAGVGTQDRCRTALALLGVAPGLVRSPPCPPTHPACLPACQRPALPAAAT